MSDDCMKIVKRVFDLCDEEKKSWSLVRDFRKEASSIVEVGIADAVGPWREALAEVVRCHQSLTAHVGHDAENAVCMDKAAALLSVKGTPNDDL